MKKVTLIGIDLAKNIFRINCLDEKGKCLENRNMTRETLIKYLAHVEPCSVAMESCATSQYWGRLVQSMGHTPKLIHASHVTPYRLGGKNDANDAAAICAAAIRPDMHFVRLKTQAQSDMQSVQRVRQSLVEEHTATINQVRALLMENGITVKQGPSAVLTLLPIIIDSQGNDLSPLMRRMFRQRLEHLLSLQKQLLEINDIIKAFAKNDENCQRLQEIPGIGVISSTVLACEIGNGTGFRNGRAFAASIGLVPKQYSSGGKSKLLGITKRGNSYLRGLLVHGARAAIQSILRGGTPLSAHPIAQWLYALIERRGKNKATVALANKMARIAFAIVVKNEKYQTTYCAV